MSTFPKQLAYSALEAEPSAILAAIHTAALQRVQAMLHGWLDRYQRKGLLLMRTMSPTGSHSGQQPV